MKKRLPFVAILLTFICLLAMFTAINTAKATEIPSTNDIVDTMTDSEVFSDEDKAKIKELIATVEQYTKDSDSFIIRYIVPAGVAVVICLLGWLICLIPSLKNKGKANTYKALTENMGKEIEDYKEQIKVLESMINTDAIKQELKEYIATDMKKFISVIHEDLTKEGVELSKIETILLSIVNGAINAWQGSPEAVAKLTCNGTAEQLQNVAKQNAKLTEFILTKYGAEGKALIDSL